MIVLKILRILLCYVIFIIKVSNSQQIAVPVQPYPIYQQTGYSNAHQNVPVLIQPSNNNNHYAQVNSAQNVVPTDLAKVVISKILSSPSIHKYIDPNARCCKHKDIDVPKHGCNTGLVPHVTNNYFIVPPEYLRLNDTEVASEKIAPKLFKRVENDVVVIPAETKKDPVDNNKRTETLTDSNKDKQNHTTLKESQHFEVGQKKQTRKRTRQRNKHSTSDSEKVNDINDINNGEKIITVSTESKPKESEHPRYSLKTKNNLRNNKTRINNNNKRTRHRKENRNINHNETSNHNHMSSHVNKTDASELSLNTNILTETELSKDTQKLVDNVDGNLETQGKSDYLHTLQIVSNKNPITFDNVEKFDISKSTREDSRVTRESKDELILKDFKQKFPEVPEMLARAMLSYVQNQFQNNFATNFFYPPGFEQFFQIPQMNTSHQERLHINERKNKSRYRKRKHKHRKGSNKRRKNRKNKTKVSKNSELSTEQPPSAVKIDESAENVTIDTPLLQLKESPDIRHDLSEEISEIPIQVIEYPSNNKYQKESELLEIELSEEVDGNYNIDVPYKPEIQNEDDLVTRVYDNRLIDDYYPNFNDDTRSFDSEEYFIKNLNDRYYYTTDTNKDDILFEEFNKPYIYEEINKPRRTFKEDIPKLLKHNFKDHDFKHTYFDADREGLRNLARELPKQLPLLKPKIESPKSDCKEETGFKSPSVLEFPDFVTRKVEKSLKLEEYRHDAVDEIDRYDHEIDEQPTYLNSEIYSNFLKENGGNKRTRTQEKPNDVETVYANSKVVKYGTNNAHDLFTNDHFANKDNNDGHISYVIAKSLGNPDEIEYKILEERPRT